MLISYNPNDYGVDNDKSQHLDGRSLPTSILFTCNILDRTFNSKKYDIKYQENSRNQFSLDYGYAVVTSKIYCDNTLNSI